MALQVRDVLYRPVCVHMRVTLVSITLKAAKGMFFVESMHPIIFPSRPRCTKHHVTNKRLVEELARNLDGCHVRHVFVHLPRPMHQS